MKKNYLILIIVIVLIVGIYAYLNNGLVCYDGYGSGLYVTKSELTTKLSSTGSGSNDLNIMINGLNKIAFESYGCGNTSYSIKNDIVFKRVSQSDFQKFIDSNSGLYKITQSGNSPYFVKDLTTGDKYFIEQKDGKYILSIRSIN